MLYPGWEAEAGGYWEMVGGVSALHGIVQDLGSECLDVGCGQDVIDLRACVRTLEAVERADLFSIRPERTVCIDKWDRILSLDQAATLAHLAPSTIKRLTSEGRCTHSVRRRKSWNG